MKLRLLVMNGQRLVQTEQEGRWQTVKVTKAGRLKPGLYFLYLARPASPSECYEGVIVYADSAFVYQQLDKVSSIKHPRASFDKLPELGCITRLHYEGDRAISTPPSSAPTKPLPRRRSRRV